MRAELSSPRLVKYTIPIHLHHHSYQKPGRLPIRAKGFLCPPTAAMVIVTPTAEIPHSHKLKPPQPLNVHSWPSPFIAIAKTSQLQPTHQIRMYWTTAILVCSHTFHSAPVGRAEQLSQRWYGSWSPKYLPSGPLAWTDFFSQFTKHHLQAKCCLGSVEGATGKTQPLPLGTNQGYEAGAGCGWLKIISPAGGHLSRDLEGGGVKDEEASKPRERQVWGPESESEQNSITWETASWCLGHSCFPWSQPTHPSLSH